MSTLIIYHRVDFDGLFSAAIINKFTIDNKKEVPEFFGWNYGDKELPSFDFINKFDQIIMADISFPPEVMMVFKNTGKVIWIDHHYTSITNSKQYGYDDMPGIRKKGVAACELVWEFFYPKVKCPKIIQYVGTYDVWDKNRFNWEEETLPIQYALRSQFELKLGRLLKRFNDLITNVDALKFLITTGKSSLKDKRLEWKSSISNYGFPVTVAGKYKGIAILSPISGSAMFESVLPDYDIYIVSNRLDSGHFSLKMYKEADRLPEFNCAEYVHRTFGNGGGHESACGTVISIDDFNKLIVDCKL